MAENNVVITTSINPEEIQLELEPKNIGHQLPPV